MEVRTWALKNVGRTILTLRADPLVTSPIFPSENSSVQLFPGASVEIEQDRMEEEQILHLRRKGLLIATPLVRLLYTSSSSSHSSSSSSASSSSSQSSSSRSSSSSSSKSSSSSISSSSSSATPPPPNLILTISGLTGGQTYLGLGNGIHTVAPTFYQAAPNEVWKKDMPTTFSAGNYERLALFAFPTWYSTQIPFMMRTPRMFGAEHIHSTTDSFIGSYVASRTFSLTYGPVTAKIKNRAFGQIIGTSGVTISWQRAPNWPANP